jgi:PAS domain S-box-containing protein
MVGISLTEIARSESFAAETILGGSALIIPDATQDARFQTLSLVTTATAVRFYAGIPIITEEGFAVGALSVMNTAPHSLSTRQRSSLEALARQTLALLEMRLQVLKYEDTIKALAESERRFRNIADASPMLLWLSDEGDNRTFFSKAWYNFTGLTYDESLADGWRAAIHPDDLAQYELAWIQRKERQTKLQREYRLRHNSGSYRWMLEQAVPMASSHGRAEAYVCSCVDLSTRHAEEVDRHNNEARFRAVSEAAPLGIFVTDTAGSYIYTNHQFQRISGQTAEESLGSGWSKAIHVEDRARILSTWNSSIQSNSPFDQSCRYVRGDGTLAWCSVKAATITTNDTVTGWVGVVEDITTTHQFEQELVAAKHAAESAMHTKSQFLANMSHEMRTPLTAIIGFAEAIMQDFRSDPKELHCLQVILNNSNHLLEVINDILDLSKLDAGAVSIEESTIELIPMVEEIRSMFSPRIAEKALSFSVHYEWPLPRWLATDVLRLKQVIINLLSNSIKFTEKGWIEVRVSFNQSSEEISISVSDSGIGMTNDQQAKLFQPFSQANESITRKYGGTGLGLTISRRLARALGGDIQVTSEPGRGSVFTLTVKPRLPDRELITTDRSPGERAVSTHFTKPPALKGHVLFADDAVDNRQLVQYLLSKVGLSAVMVDDGSQALQAALSQPFDLILLDIQMPNVDGLTAARGMREAGIRTPIVALSASTMSSDVLEAVEAGCSMHLGKPFSSQSFYNMLARFLPTAQMSITTSERGKIADRCAASVLHDPVTAIFDAQMIPLLHQFLTRLPARLEEIKAAIAASDGERVLLLAHRLKGSAGLYGFPLLADLGATLESQYAVSTPAQADQLLEELARIINSVQRADT